MNWEDVLKIIGAAVFSAGGIGGIIVLVVKFTANKFADHISKKYEAKLNKDLEEYKSELEKEIEQYKSALNKKEYISKTRFDAEFSIYRELSKTFFDLARDINTLIPFGNSEKPADKDKYEEYLEECYKKAEESFTAAQETLHQNAPFIAEEIYLDYSEILNLSRLQLFAYLRRYNVLYFGFDKKEFTANDNKRSRIIVEKQQAITKKIRDYLASLDVAE